MWYIYYAIGNRDATFEYKTESEYLMNMHRLILGGRARIISHGWKETLASL